MSKPWHIDDALVHLQQVVNRVQPLSGEEWQRFAQPWKLRSAARRQSLTVAGNREGYLYFILEGVQRIFYLDEQGREATLLFTYAPSFGGVVDALLQQTPSPYYYETITASQFLVLPFADLDRLLQEVPAVDAFVRKALTASLSGLLQRMVELQCFSSEEKFRRLLQCSPHILHLVPHKYLANYLGINATNFSKLLNQVRI